MAPRLLKPEHNDTTTDPIKSSAQDPPIDASTTNSSTSKDTLARPANHTSKSVGAVPASSQLHWPISPRLKSPPPSSVSRRPSQNSLKQLDGVENRITGQDPSTSQVDTPTRSGRSQTASNLPMKPSRGTSGMPPMLETVQEGDLPNSTDDSSVTSSRIASPIQDKPRSSAVNTKDHSPEKQVSSVRPSASDKRRVTPAVVSKVRGPAEGSTQNMIVETETVSSIPQSSTVANTDLRGSLRPDGPGGLRAKPSTDTIRPKKIRKKPTKKTPSITSGTNSTKADLFEARVNSEIEGDTSDSDETFVYESNPPEPRSRARHHSRTPSTTSMQSLAGDRRAGMRSLGHVLDSHRVRTKRSMKFSSSSHGAASSMDDDQEDNSGGTVRASRRDNDNNYQQMGLFTRLPGEGNIESDSPYSRARGRSNSHALNAPRTPPRADLFPSDYKGSSGDESTPLLHGADGSLRGHRLRTRGGDRASRLRNEMFDYEEPRRSCYSRISGCVIMLTMIILIVLGAAAVLVSTTKALEDVQVVAIENILTSEQEIMLDLTVQAVNPNIMTISVNDMDVNVFAKSRYVGTESAWRREHPGEAIPIPTLPDRHIHLSGGVDDGTDPPDGDLEGDPATMLLGRIFSFDSALTFEGSPFKHSPSNSSGELRVNHPGNKTEYGGTERWEKVIQHPFELIVRGVLKYQLPLNSRSLTKSIAASVAVKPPKDDSDVPSDGDGKGDDGGDNGRGDGGGNVGPPGRIARRRLRMHVRSKS